MGSALGLIFLVPALFWPWEDLGLGGVGKSEAALTRGIPGVPKGLGSNLVSVPLCSSPSRHNK